MPEKPLRKLSLATTRVVDGNYYLSAITFIFPQNKVRVTNDQFNIVFIAYYSANLMNNVKIIAFLLFGLAGSKFK